jgi:hypothetical protein
VSAGGDDGSDELSGDAGARREAPGRAGAETAPEAIARAARHARIALAESARALVALLDAASLAASGEPAAAGPLLGRLSRSLDGLASELDGAVGSGAAGLLAAIAEALDAEIARWELRARDDADARAVLRAFLGLRELLWELGVRRPGEPADAGAGPTHSRPARTRRAGPRVQRVRVEG